VAPYFFDDADAKRGDVPVELIKVLGDDVVRQVGRSGDRW